MKTKHSVIFFTIATLLGLLTLVVFQKGISTNHTMIQDARNLQTNSDIASLPSNPKNHTLESKIAYLEAQVKQLSQQQNDLIYNLEKLLVKLPNKAAACIPSSPPVVNKNI